MKTLFAILALTLLVVTGIGAQEAAGTVVDIELDGRQLALAEMEEATGGLPRCCDDLNYDPIEDKCLNNIGQNYEGGSNDCDLWIENVLGQACINISAAWGPAFTTSVQGHIQVLSGQLSDYAPQGWSIEFIDGSHVALIRVNADGSADLYHQGLNAKTPTTISWEGSRGYHYSDARSACWGDEPRFWSFDR